MTYCQQCLEKQQRINELEEEIIQLKGKLRRRINPDYYQLTATDKTTAVIKITPI